MAIDSLRGQAKPGACAPSTYNVAGMGQSLANHTLLPE
jgi:hypothetical protein